MSAHVLLNLLNESKKRSNTRLAKGQSVVHHLYSGSYMSAHVLLNLLNELEKRDKI